jgi:hypothetical protein
MSTKSVYCLYRSWGVLSFLRNRDLHKEVRKVCFSPAMSVTRNGKVRHYANWRLEKNILQAIIQSKLPAPEFMVFNSNPYEATNLGNYPKSVWAPISRTYRWCVSLRHVLKSPVISGRARNKCAAASISRNSTTPRPIRAPVVRN